MADKEVSELTAAGAITGDELVHVVQSGNSRKVTVAELLDWLFDVYEPADGETLVYDSSAGRFINASGSGDVGLTALTPVFNFTDDGEARYYADVAMTLTQQSTSGTGSVAYEKSTAAAPGTFSSTSSPITLEAGAWLKVTASGVSSIFAVALKRTA